MSAALPEGPRGKALALALAAAVAGAAWVGVAAPLIDLYGDRAERLDTRRTLARRMDGVAASLPELRREATASAATGPAANALLDGASDAIAGARLQEIVQTMAGRVGATFSSLETLPTDQTGAYHRIALRVSMNAGWPVLVGLLRTIHDSTPRLLVDDLRLEGSRLVARSGGENLDAVFTVIGFRPAAPSSAPSAPPPSPLR